VSAFTRAAATMQTVTLNASEEASRRGQRDVDIDHLFLALVLSSDDAGQALRALGISLDRARAAVADLHADQLRSLGITTGIPDDGAITFHETDGYELTPRALTVMKRSGAGKKTGDSADVLRELVAEPSGLVVDLLARLGSTSDDVHAQLDAIAQDGAGGEPAPERPAATRDRGVVVQKAESFVPAPIADVWALLAAPSRMPEWDPSVARVDPPTAPEGAAPGAPGAGTTWVAHVRTERPDGKPMKVKAPYRRRGVELLTAEEPFRIAWRTTFPDAPSATPFVLRIELSAAPGGTQLTVTTTRPRRGGWRWIVGLPLRPVQRFLLWLQAAHVGAAVGRVFR
jgi:uncharacterized protein YndB with AHSA1/START domain